MLATAVMIRGLNHACRALAAAELPLVLLIAPALLFPTPGRLLLVSLVLVSWSCHWWLDGRPIPATPLNASIVLLLVMAGVSTVATFDLAFSLGKLSGLLLGVMLFWAAARWIVTPERLAVATAAFLLSGATLAILGLFGTRWMSKFPVLTGIVAVLPAAIRGVPGAEEGFHPNPVAGALLLFIPLQLALLPKWTHAELLARHENRWSLPIQSLLLCLTAGTLLLTQSRGAWAAAIVATLAFLTWRGGRPRAVALAAVGALAIVAGVIGPQRLFDLAISQAGPGMPGNVAGRVELWSKAMIAIEDFPLTGMGMNAFRIVMPVMYPMSMSLLAPEVEVAHAHNHLLQAALDLGVPGLIAYLSIWILAGLLLVRVHRQAFSPAYRAMAKGLGAGLFAHFVFSMTDAIPLGAKVGVLFWLTLALVVSLHQVALPSTSRRADSSSTSS